MYSWRTLPASARHVKLCRFAERRRGGITNLSFLFDLLLSSMRAVADARTDANLLVNPKSAEFDIQPEFEMKKFLPICQPLISCAIVTVAVTSALQAETHFQRACNRGCIPTANGRNYGHDTARFQVTDFAVANAVTGQGNQLRKPFHFRALALDLDHLHLEQVGLTIYKADGKVVATGRITHSGGDGGLIGSNVIIRVRAFVAASPETARIPPDSVAVWESEQKIWVPRGGPQSISLVPAHNYLTQSQMTEHFEEITHLEVTMEYRRDR